MPGKEDIHLQQYGPGIFLMSHEKPYFMSPILVMTLYPGRNKVGQEVYVYKRNLSQDNGIICAIKVCQT